MNRSMLILAIQSIAVVFIAYSLFGFVGLVIATFKFSSIILSELSPLAIFIYYITTIMNLVIALMLLYVVPTARRIFLLFSIVVIPLTFILTPVESYNFIITPNIFAVIMLGILHLPCFDTFFSTKTKPETSP